MELAILLKIYYDKIMNMLDANFQGDPDEEKRHFKGIFLNLFLYHNADTNTMLMNDDARVGPNCFLHCRAIWAARSWGRERGVILQ